MKYKRILLKLSGESLQGSQKYGLSPEVLQSYAEQIRAAAATGVQIGIVIGGGNIFRGLTGAKKGFDRVKGDQMGMLATIINSLALQSALEDNGVKAKVLTSIRMEPIGEYYSKARAIEYLEAGYVVIIGGGTSNPYFTTDSASALRGIEIEADVMLKGTRVDGVYTADPRIVKDAKKIDVITYDEMLELASLGAKVLHNRSVEMAKKYNVELVVRSSLNRSEGTVVKEASEMEKLLVTGVAADKNTARISVIGVEDKPGIAFRIFDTLAGNNINVDIILQSVGREGTKDISFTVASDDLENAIRILEENKKRLTIQDITWNEKVAKLSIVGAGMMSNPGVAAKMFESLYNSRVNINMISTSEIRITVLVAEDDIEQAMIAVHDGFALAD